jgi:hypothetical protein
VSRGQVDDEALTLHAFQQHNLLNRIVYETYSGDYFDVGEGGARPDPKQKPHRQ